MENVFLTIISIVLTIMLIGIGIYGIICGCIVGGILMILLGVTWTIYCIAAYNHIRNI